MRLVAAAALLPQVAASLQGPVAVKSAAFAISAGCAGVLLFVGLWTPVAGSLVVLFEFVGIAAHSRDPWNCILLGTFGICLALLGPGAWSVDAYLFGWKRIDIEHPPS